MIALDTDVLTGVLQGNPLFTVPLAAIPHHEQSVPIVVIEEIMPGRLAVIRRADAGKAKVSIDRAYLLFENTFNDFRQLRILPYTSEADLLYTQWREQKIRVSTHDLRIAAISVVHGATLVSRNRRDFAQVPTLSVEFWG